MEINILRDNKDCCLFNEPTLLLYIREKSDSMSCPSRISTYLYYSVVIDEFAYLILRKPSQ